MGISYDEFWHYNPHKIKVMQKAHMEVIKEKDYLAWRFCGDYVMSAVYYAIEHNLHGKKAKYKYAEKPAFQQEVHEKKVDNEGQAIIDRMNFELRMKILKDMGYSMPPR